LLEDCKHLYESKADAYLKNWRKTNKNKLINNCIDCKDKNIREAYISAILVRYWKLFNKLYTKCKYTATPEECFDWVVDAVMYAVNNYPWRIEGQSIYKDPTGPDKVVNKVAESRRITYYQQLNRFNRKINSEILSLDILVSDYGDMFEPIDDKTNTIWDEELVKKFFNKKDYFLSFMLDAIFNLDVFEVIEEENGIYTKFSEKKIIKHLHHLDKYYKIFAEKYGIDCNKVLKATEYCSPLSTQKMKTKIRKNILFLKKYYLQYCY
jgi:hypothetical protein